MKRNKLFAGKTAALCSLSALCVLSGTFLTQAAGWTQEGENWCYYDNYGDRVTNEWRKSAKGFWFWLDDNGLMVKNAVVDDGEHYYYVNEDGAMSTNRWVSCDPEVIGEDGGEDVWLYFGANGRAYKDTGSEKGFVEKTINGKRYAFNENGRMLTGLVSGDGEMLDEGEEESFLEAEYYFGGSSDGAMQVNGWYLYDGSSDADSNVSGISYSDYDNLWLYFGSNGKKVIAETGKERKEKTINGQKYVFDENGVMLSEWAGTASASSAASTKYYSSSMDGHMKKNRWVYAVPDEEMDPEDYADDQARWFYSGSNGRVYKNGIKTVNGKKYMFDENGIMLSGFVITDENNKPVGTIDAEEYGREDFLKGDAAEKISGGELYYFGADEAGDGSMKTGKTVRIELSDDTYTFGFASTGKAYGTDGVELVSSRYYQNGLMLQADRDSKYGIVKDQDGKLIAVGTSGTKQTGNGKALRDGNGGYILLKDNAYFAYVETDDRPLYQDGAFYEYDESASGHKGAEISQDTEGSDIPKDLKLNFE